LQTISREIIRQIPAFMRFNLMALNITEYPNRGIQTCGWRSNSRILDLVMRANRETRTILIDVPTLRQGVSHDGTAFGHTRLSWAAVLEAWPPLAHYETRPFV
jgi:hypothetical protein